MWYCLPSWADQYIQYPPGDRHPGQGMSLVGGEPATLPIRGTGDLLHRGHIHHWTGERTCPLQVAVFCGQKVFG